MIMDSVLFLRLRWFFKAMGNFFEGPLNVCNLNVDEIGMLINNH
jgi:hypothetical protein